MCRFRSLDHFAARDREVAVNQVNEGVHRDRGDIQRAWGETGQRAVSQVIVVPMFSSRKLSALGLGRTGNGAHSQKDDV